MLKRCGRCKQHKEATSNNFHKASRFKDGLATTCRTCRTEYNITHTARRQASNTKWRHNNLVEFKKKQRSRWLKLYGLTVEDYEIMLNKQNRSCLICLSSDRRFHVDHCHKTNKVRGILCELCNKGLGQFKDDVGIIFKAAEYLIKSQEKKNG